MNPLNDRATIAMLMTGLFLMFVLAIWLWDSRDYWRGRYTALKELQDHDDKMSRARDMADRWKNASRN